MKPCSVCGSPDCPRPKSEPTLESLAAELDALRHQVALLQALRAAAVPYPVPVRRPVYRSVIC